jgi:hypothetical protein
LQRVSADIHIEAGSPMRILSRATDVTGVVQPMSGARNASVAIEVQVKG